MGVGGKNNAADSAGIPLATCAGLIFIPYT